MCPFESTTCSNKLLYPKRYKFAKLFFAEKWQNTIHFQWELAISGNMSEKLNFMQMRSYGRQQNESADSDLPPDTSGYCSSKIALAGRRIKTVNLACQILFLAIYLPSEFRSNSALLLMILISWFRCISLELDLNLAEGLISGNRIGHP